MWLSVAWKCAVYYFQFLHVTGAADGVTRRRGRRRASFDIGRSSSTLNSRLSMNGRTNLERSGGFAAAASTAVAADAAEIVDDWGQMRSTSPRPGSQEAIRRSAERADIDLDDVWVQPELYITTEQFRANRSVIGRLPPAAKDTLATGGVCNTCACTDPSVGSCISSISALSAATCTVDC